MKEKGGVGQGVLMTIGAIVVFIMLLFGACAVCVNDDDDNNSLGPITLVAYHHGDDGGDSYDYDEGCGRDGGGCNNRRREDYQGAGCKYVCPSFDKSPVHDAFNFAPFVCMPGATCYEDGDKRQHQGDEDQPR